MECPIQRNCDTPPPKKKEKKNTHKQNIKVWWQKVIRMILGLWPIPHKVSMCSAKLNKAVNRLFEFRQRVKGITEFHPANQVERLKGCRRDVT